MAEERVERRLAAILAADVAGYSRLMGVNEEGTLTALKRQQSGVLLNALGMVIERRPAERSRWCGKLNGKSRKKRWRQFHCEFLKQPHRTRYVAAAQMHDRQVECANVPLGHDFNKSPVADQLGLHDRREIANAQTAQQSGREASVVVYRKIRFERQRFLIFSVLMPKGPAVVWSPMREREQFVIEQIPWRSWSFDPFKVGGARN